MALSRSPAGSPSGRTGLLSCFRVLAASVAALALALAERRPEEAWPSATGGTDLRPASGSVSPRRCWAVRHPVSLLLRPRAQTALHASGSGSDTVEIEAQHEESFDLSLIGFDDEELACRLAAADAVEGFTFSFDRRYHPRRRRASRTRAHNPPPKSSSVPGSGVDSVVCWSVSASGL